MLACSGKKNSEQTPSQPVSSNTQVFCENIRHFESFYLCRSSHEMGVDDDELCPLLWDYMPALSPDKLPDSKALATAIEKDCKKPTADCKIFNNTCSEEQKKAKHDVLNCIHNTVERFKKEKCPHL